MRIRKHVGELRMEGFGYTFRRGPWWWIRFWHRGTEYREPAGCQDEQGAYRRLKRRHREILDQTFIDPRRERDAPVLPPTSPPPPPPWTTYFLADGAGRVKIGRTRNVAGRIRDLSTSTAQVLSLLGTIPDDVEGVWHARWRACRIRGEWFTLTPELAHALRETLGLPVPEDPLAPHEDERPA
jgi:hypothetical protein